jgi:putative ABC transport system substrate-binding protein
MKVFRDHNTALKGAVLLLSGLLHVICPSVEAQSQRLPRIGYLTLRASPSESDKAFLQALQKLGYIDGQNITIQYRWAAGKVENLPKLAEELVGMQADLIIAATTPAVQAAKSATSTIPIVMTGSADPVGSGLVASLARPGGNVTGMSSMLPELAGKRLEVLKETIPKLSRVGFLAHGRDPAHRLFVKEAQEAGEKLGIHIQPAVVHNSDEIEDALSALIKTRTRALIVQTLFVGNVDDGRRIAELAMGHSLPTVSDGNRFAELGGLLFYGPRHFENILRAAVYVDKILKGAKPAELPVEQPTKFEMVINLRTAKQIRLTIPPNVLARADRVLR